MSVLPTKAALFGLLALSVFCTKHGMAQSTDTAAPMPMDHSAMTPAQHAAMHGGADPAKAQRDSSFAALQERGKMAMGVDQYASAHHFDVLPNGGRIALEMKGADSLGCSDTRTHEAHRARFSGGRFLHAGVRPHARDARDPDHESEQGAHSLHLRGSTAWRRSENRHD